MSEHECCECVRRLRAALAQAEQDLRSREAECMELERQLAEAEQAREDLRALGHRLKGALAETTQDRDCPEAEALEQAQAIARLRTAREEAARAEQAP